MAVIPCDRNRALQLQVEEFAEVLKTQSHMLGTHGLDEREFYQSGLFRGAIERIRGQYAASMGEKRGFVRLVLNHMQDRGFIRGYNETGGANRHDYVVHMPSGRESVIELKGCLDGNNTNIFDRPTFAREFIMWSVCSNANADPRLNVRSGIHTRLSAEIIERQVPVDGLIVWDWLCGTISRPCPKLQRTVDAEERLTTVGQYQVTPPCIYLFPPTVPSPRTNPEPAPNRIHEVEFLAALHECFLGADDELNYVYIKTGYVGVETVRETAVVRGGVAVHQAGPTAIQRR